MSKLQFFQDAVEQAPATIEAIESKIVEARKVLQGYQTEQHRHEATITYAKGWVGAIDTIKEALADGSLRLADVMKAEAKEAKALAEKLGIPYPNSANKFKSDLLDVIQEVI